MNNSSNDLEYLAIMKGLGFEFYGCHCVI